MKKSNQIKNAIDESLSGVRFNAHDARSVLASVRSQEQEAARPSRSRRMRLFDFAVSAAAVALVVVPVTLFALRAHHSSRPSVAAHGLHTPPPDVVTYLTPKPAATEAPIDDTQAPTPALTPAPDPGAEDYSEDEAVRIARACFEEKCDTSIFTFEEYAVSTAYSAAEQAVTVVMESIYDNGCRFSVVVSCADGSVLQYSTPRLATSPAFVDSESDEVRSWYEKNGAHLLAWPQDQQAEFSRRYEGGMLRAAREGEITYEQAQQIALEASREAFASLGVSGSASIYCYPMLYSESASGDGAARYVVHCYDAPASDVLSETCVLVTLRADSGAVESIQNTAQ